MSADATDQIIANRYRILRQIGRGGMGAVYQAQDLSLDRVVALKMFHPAPTPDPDFDRRIEREIAAMSGVQHRNVVTLYDHFLHDGRNFLVLEYIDGGNVADLLQNRGKLEPQQAVSITRQVADALTYLHQRGLVHRDVKPSNILLTKDGTPKLSDLGLVVASGAASLTSTGLALGTPAYVAPEQVTGQTSDPRVDIYSLGIVLYEMLSGRPPFRGGNIGAILRGHLETPPPPLRKENPALPAALEQLVLRCLEKDYSRRYQSAEALIGALDALEITPPPPNSVNTDTIAISEDKPPPSDTPRWLPVGLGLIALLLVFVALFSLFGARGTAPPIATPTIVPTATPAIPTPPAANTLPALLLATAALAALGGAAAFIAPRLRVRAAASAAAPAVPATQSSRPSEPAPSPDPPAALLLPRSDAAIASPLPAAPFVHTSSKQADETMPFQPLELPRSTPEIEREFSHVAWLLALNGALRGQQFRLKKRTTIGRNRDCTLVLPDEQVSRVHAAVELEAEQFVLVDAESHNGTLLNGHRIEGRRPLHDRDEIQIGGTIFHFVQAISSRELDRAAQQRRRSFDTLWEQLTQAARHER